MNNGAHRPPIDDLWYKNAIIYCLDVEKYVDSNGDGIGDFGGLTRHPPAARLSRRPGYHLRLAPAILSVSQSRQRLRRCRLLRRAPKARHPWRVRRVYESRATDRLTGDRRFGDQPHVEPSSLVSIRAQGSSVGLPELVCLVEDAPCRMEQGDGISRRAESDLDP